MELTKEAIRKNFSKVPGLDGYSLIISKIENNVNANPDIAIEACKSLIEGLSLKSMSLLSDKYKSSKSYRTKCKQSLTFLTKNVFDEVYSDYVESVIHKNLTELLLSTIVLNRIKLRSLNKTKEQLTETIGKISAIRNERGDISHGRVYPKNKESHINFTKSIESITDGICSFMIYELSNQYQSKLDDDGKLNFEKLEKFNFWLDKKHKILSVKVDFSQLLYKNAYDKYEEYYNLEYIDSEDYEPEEDTEEITVVEPEITEEPKLVKEIVKLVSTFNEELFWSNANNVTETQNFAQTENLIDNELKKLINNYLFTDKRPLRDDVLVAMNNKPKLSERKTIIEALTEKIIALSKQLSPTQQAEEEE